MIPRYARPDMVKIWDAETRFKIWFEIEAHATDALAELGVVPKSAAKALWDWWRPTRQSTFPPSTPSKPSPSMT